MKIVVEELITTLTQEIEVTTKIQTIAIRPRIYVHNDPTGTFTFSIINNSTTIGSKSLTLAQIISGAGWAAGQYHHGFLKFEFDYPIILHPGTYNIQLSASGYAYAGASYLGWIRDHEDLLVEYTGTILTDLQKPLSLEMWGY